jgi:hypothetical protein
VFHGVPGIVRVVPSVVRVVPSFPVSTGWCPVFAGTSFSSGKARTRASKRDKACKASNFKGLNYAETHWLNGARPSSVRRTQRRCEQVFSYMLSYFVLLLASKKASQQLSKRLIFSFSNYIACKQLLNNGHVMGKQSEASKKEEGTLKEFLIERVKFYEAIWDNANANHVKVTVVTNCWLKILQAGFLDGTSQIDMNISTTYITYCNTYC